MSQTHSQCFLTYYWICRNNSNNNNTNNNYTNIINNNNHNKSKNNNNNNNNNNNKSRPFISYFDYYIITHATYRGKKKTTPKVIIIKVLNIL